MAIGAVGGKGDFWDLFNKCVSPTGYDLGCGFFRWGRDERKRGMTEGGLMPTSCIPITIGMRERGVYYDGVVTNYALGGEHPRCKRGRE